MKAVTLAQFLTDSSAAIISEWEEFARAYIPAASTMDLTGRRDHIAGMLESIAIDLAEPQTATQQTSKSKGTEDADAGSDTAANSHGTDRAATGFSVVEVVSEFRALRASVLRLWSETQQTFTREHLDEVTRFNEAIDQLLVESMTTYVVDVDRSKDLFLGVLGHDLRNPLGAVMMSATVMMTQEGPDWRHAKTAARILNAGTRMDALISDLVDFTRSRLGSGIPIVRAHMDLATTCRQTVDEITAYYPGRTVNLEAAGELWGEWDAGRMGQLLSNLLGNAFQHGSARTSVEVRVSGDPDSVVLTVHNQGGLIPTANLRTIFDPFKQGDPATSKAKDSRSVGLGLYIVDAIVVAHGGAIAVTSNEQGTTFTVTLPRKPTQPRLTAAAPA